MLIISVDGFSFETNFTAVAATLNNIGPGLDLVGPTSNFFGYGPVSKLILIFDPFLSVYLEEERIKRFTGKRGTLRRRETAGAEGKEKMVTIHRVFQKNRKTE